MTDEENRIKQAINNLTNFHTDKLRTFTLNLDNDLNIVLNLIQKQKAELKKKAEIINLMAEDIYNTQIECNRYFKDKEETKQYFEDKVNTTEHH